MKRSGILYVYLGILAAFTVLGCCLDGYFGIWRQSIIGGALLLVGFCFRFSDRKKRQKNDVKRVNRSIADTFAVSCAIAGGILLNIATRLWVTNLISSTKPILATASFSERVIGTVLLPSICVSIIAFVILPCFLEESPVWVKILVTAFAFTPFCTNIAYMPAVFLFGLICGVCNNYIVKIRWEEIFVSYAILLFYDTLSVSIGSIDFNLSMRQVVSFLFICLSIACILAYLSFRVFKEKKIRFAEFLTVLLIVAILLCVGFAL